MSTATPPPLTPDQLTTLKLIDTPTICNAIESFKIRGRVEGFCGMDIRCLSPDLGVMVGYAVTLTVDSTTPNASSDSRIWHQWMAAMAASPQPVVLVLQDVGPQPRKSAHFGEVMGTLARRLGTVGVVSNGGLRDLNEVRHLGLHYFGPGLVPSHGQPRLLSVNQAVEIDGVAINPGDLLHGDVNGLTMVPAALAGQVAVAADAVRAEEAELLAYIQSPAFSIDGFYERKFTH